MKPTAGVPIAGMVAAMGGAIALWACDSSPPQAAAPGTMEDAAQPTVDDSGSAPSADGTASSPAVDGASGEDGTTGCVGVPIVPDDTGFVADGTNSVGIHGSWFVYSDCNDLHNVNCATVMTPSGTGFANTGGSMCTSGTTSSAAGAWGAGIALELNDVGGQLPFDTVAAGIKGFCFQLSGPMVPSTTVRVAFPTQDNNDNAYFEPVSALGQHTVLFAGTAQGSWVTTPQPFEPTKVTLIQFQIPSSSSAPVAWDFCISGLTAVVQ